MQAGIEFDADLIEIGTNQSREFIENINQVSEKREEEFTKKNRETFARSDQSQEKHPRHR